MTTSRVGWRDIAELIRSFFFPGRFDKEIQTLLDQGYAQDEAVRLLAGLVGHYLVEGAGLAAALGSPVYVALDNLSELTRYLETFSAPSGLNGDTCSSFFHFDQAYARFVEQVCPLFPQLGRAMTSVLWAYITDNYGLQKDPNQVILRAQQMVSQSPVEAKLAIASVGAMALRGCRPWWGWSQEICPPLRPWMRTIMAFVDSVTQDGERPFMTVARQRQLWADEAAFTGPLLAALRDGRCALARIQFSQRPEPADARIDGLLFRLFGGKEALSADLGAAFAAHRDAAVPHLVGLALDERLWESKSIGEGWAPIHAVDLLGDLGASEAADALVQIVARADSEDLLYDHALLALCKMGGAALKPVLEVMRYSGNRALKLALAPTLGLLGRGSAEACHVLMDLYNTLSEREDPGLVIMGLIDLQDREAIPVLKAALRNRRLLPMDRDEIQQALAAMEVLV